MKTSEKSQPASLSRREFISTTAVAGAALLAAPSLLAKSQRTLVG